jgi:hypothetical protein
MANPISATLYFDNIEVRATINCGLQRRRTADIQPFRHLQNQIQKFY